MSIKKYTYSFASGIGDEGNHLFSLTKDGVLKTASIFDYEEYSAVNPTGVNIRVRVTDQRGFFYENTFFIRIEDVQEVPDSLKIDVVLIGAGGGAGGMEDGYAGPGGSGSQLSFSANIDKNQEWGIKIGFGGGGGTYKDGRYSGRGLKGINSLDSNNEVFDGGDGGLAGNHGIDGGGSGSGGGGGAGTVFASRKKSGQDFTEQESLNEAVYFGTINKLFGDPDGFEVLLHLRYYNMAMDNDSYPTSARNESFATEYKNKIVSYCERNKVRILTDSGEHQWNMVAVAAGGGGGTGRKELSANPGKGGDPSPFQRSVQEHEQEADIEHRPGSWAAEMKDKYGNVTHGVAPGTGGQGFDGEGDSPGGGGGGGGSIGGLGATENEGSYGGLSGIRNGAEIFDKTLIRGLEGGVRQVVTSPTYDSWVDAITDDDKFVLDRLIDAEYLLPNGDLNPAEVWESHSVLTSLMGSHIDIYSAISRVMQLLPSTQYPYGTTKSLQDSRWGSREGDRAIGIDSWYNGYTWDGDAHWPIRPVYNIEPNHYLSVGNEATYRKIAAEFIVNERSDTLEEWVASQKIIGQNRMTTATSAATPSGTYGVARRTMLRDNSDEWWSEFDIGDAGTGGYSNDDHRDVSSYDKAVATRNGGRGCALVRYKASDSPRLNIEGEYYSYTSNGVDYHVHVITVRRKVPIPIKMEAANG